MKKIITTLAMCAALNCMAQTTLPTSWSFINPSPTGASSNSPNGPEFDGPLGWSTKLDISAGGLFTYTSGSDNDKVSCKLDATGEYVKVWFTDKPGALSYYLRGTGISPAPAFSGTFTVQQSDDGNIWKDLHTFNAADLSTSFAIFTDQPLSTSRYIRFYYTNKVSGSNIALDNIVLLSAAPTPAASINIKQDTNDVVINSTFSIGNKTTNQFKIENKGTVDTLYITGSNVSGDAATEYTVKNLPAYVLANSSANFNIDFVPTSMGTRKATIQINSNDKDKGTFKFNIYGISGNLATEPTSSPTSLLFTNVKAYGFDMKYTKPSNKPERYLVLRKTNASITEMPIDGSTYKRGDMIGNAQVAYVGTDTVLKPSYILANTNYTFTVFSFNGPVGFENYLTTAPLTGTVTSTGANVGTYYNGINPGMSNFPNAIQAKINNHDTVFYGNYASILINTWLAKDTTGGKKVVYCVYTNMPYVYDLPFVWWNTGGSTGTLSREHSYAQSWMPSNNGSPWPNGTNGKEMPEYNDLHHLFPADQLLANVKRSNYPFGEVVNATYTSPTGYGKVGTDGNGKTVWEPRDEHKGDLARSLFYMATCYNGVASQNWAFSGGKFTQDTSVLMKWHRQDPPSNLEIARHELIASIQKNRNPYIDYPNWANAINFSNMTFIPGVNGINELSDNNIKIYTNQESSEVVVLFDIINRKHTAKITVLDMLGKVVSQDNTGNQRYTASLSQKGIYVVMVETENGASVKKVILY